MNLGTPRIKPRLAVRGVLLIEDRLLLVNAYKGREGGLYCAPGGGVEAGQSLPENLAREFFEETGLQVAIGKPCLVNEFHDPTGTFHQVDIYFHVSYVSGDPRGAWRDPEGVVTERRWVTRSECATLRIKPDSLIRAAWDGEMMIYDALEPILR